MDSFVRPFVREQNKQVHRAAAQGDFETHQTQSLFFEVDADTPCSSLAVQPFSPKDD